MTASDYYKKFPPRGPVSELAVKIVGVVSDGSIAGLEGADLLTLPKAVDAELQEVREVLDSLRLAVDCWCVARWKGDHDGRCQRARELMKRLGKAMTTSSETQPQQPSQICEHGQYRSLCPECSPLRITR